ncbi:hypothetical protein Tco_0089253 [Tanacetum coccineum]
MDSDKYLEGQSMQRPPLFESDSFIYWKNRFETYVKSKDLDLWHVITNGDFQPIVQNPVHHNVYSPPSSIPQLEYAPTVMIPIDAHLSMMTFLTAVVTSRYPTTNNQLRNLSNPRQQATINDGRVTLQPVQGRQTSFVAGTTRTYTPGTSGSNSGKQRTVISQANGQILHEEELVFLADPRIAEGQAAQTGLKSVRYDVSNGFDRTYPEFLRAQIRRIFLDGYGVLVVRTLIFKISSFKLKNARLLLIFTEYSVIPAILKYERLSNNSLQ